MERQNRVVGRDPSASVYGRVAAILALPSLYISTLSMARGIHGVYVAIRAVGIVDQAAIDRAAGPVGLGLAHICVGLGAGLVGLALASAALVGPGYRAKWFVRCLLPAFPFGTFAGLIVLVAGRSRSPSPEE